MLRLRDPLRLLSATRQYASQMPACSHEAPEYTGGISQEKAASLRRKNFNTNSPFFYSNPLLLHHGHRQWLWDSSGRRYLDLFGGIVTVSVGHCHPRINEVTFKQMSNLWHTTNMYLYPSLCEFTEKLISKLPGNLKSVFFVNSGSEANDLAMMMARLYTGRYEVLGLRNAYHGSSPYNVGLTAHSTWRHNTPTGAGVIHTMNPDPFRGLWGGKACRDSVVQVKRDCDCNPGECKACDRYIEQVEETLLYSGAKNGVAGMFIESIQGVGGAMQFPKEFVKRSFELIRSKGGLCISDEVQAGFGRTGTHFWGFEGHGVVPDIVSMAKGMGNGFPMAAVITTPEIAASVANAIYFNTYGGSPLSGAIGATVLDIIDEEKLQENSLEVGTYFLLELEKLQAKYPLVGDVRGKGLMIGVEFVAEPNTTKVFPLDRMLKMFEAIREKGILIGRGGIHGNILRIKPPMCITKEDVDFSISVLDEVFSEHLQH